jgi:ATP phosphoribosyltransferase
MAILLLGAIDAREKVGLKMNVPRDRLDSIVALLPAEKSPTISHLADEQWVAVEVILEETVGRELIPQLSRAGATGIISYGLKLVVA